MKTSPHVLTAAPVAITAGLTLSLIALAIVITPAPAHAQVQSPLANKGIAATPQLKTPITSDRPVLRIPGSVVSTATMTVKQIEAKPGEFPPITANQYKVAFECRITATPAQTDHSKFPRYSCLLDQKQTSAMNGLPIQRVDNFPAADGVLTRIVMVADKSAKNPHPGRIRTAFQLLHEKSSTAYEPVQKDFTYVDALLAK